MLNIDFFKPQEKTEELTIEIEPVSCLSIADKVNSSFVDCSKIISHNKIYGLLENITDLTFETEERNQIKKITKAEKNMTPDHKLNIGYLPIIDDICEIVYIPKLSMKSSFIDFASNLLTASDIRHINGSRISDKSYQNLSAEEKVEKLKMYKNLSKKEKAALIEKYGEDACKITPEMRKEKKDFLLKFPQFYTGTIKRKYIFVDPFQIKIKTTKEFSELLKSKISVNCSAFLGNSESIVNLKLV